MKKSFIIIIILMFSLFGCSKRDIKKIMNPDYDIEYLANVKSIQLDGNYGLNNISDLVNALIYQHFVDRNEAQEIDENSVKWEINGDTKTGTMILITYKDCEVYLSVTEDGDYIKTDTSQGYVKSSNKSQSFDELYNEYATSH